MRKLQIVIQRVRKCVTSHLRGIKHGAEYDCGQRNAKGSICGTKSRITAAIAARKGDASVAGSQTPFRVFVGIQGQTGNG